MVCSGACFDAHTCYDVRSRVVRGQVIVVRVDVHDAAITIKVWVSPCRRVPRRAESAKITGQRYHGDGDSDRDKCDYRSWERTLFCIHVFPPSGSNFGRLAGQWAWFVAVFPQLVMYYYITLAERL